MQLAVAAYVCPAAQAEPGAFGTNAMADCAGVMPLAMDPAQPLLCQAHCQQGTQTVQPAPTQDAPASLVLLAVLDWSSAALLPSQPAPAAAQVPALHSGAPPPGSPPLYLALLVLRN